MAPVEEFVFHVTDDGRLISGYGDVVVDETGILDEETLEAIVRRSNCHAELLAALKAVLDHCPCDWDINEQFLAAYYASKAAVVKAEGSSPTEQ